MITFVVFLCSTLVIFANCSNPRFKRADDGIGSDDTYESSGLRLTTHGVEYQLKLLMLMVARQHNEGDRFELATEFDPAGKFDDAVLKVEKNTQDAYLCVQAKHKIIDKKITKKDLLSTDNDAEFNMLKYFKSFRMMIESKFFNLVNLKELVLISNIDFNDELKSLMELEKNFNPGNALQLQEGEFYKIGKALKDELERTFQDASDQRALFGALVNHIENDKKFDLRELILRKYRYALVEHKVIDLNRKKLHVDFVTGTNNFDKDFRDEFERYLDALNSHPSKKSKKAPLTLQSLGQVTLKFSENFVKSNGDRVALPKDTISSARVNEFCERFVFAVNQPNNKELDEHIQKELSKKYNPLDVKRIFHALFYRMFDWLSARKGSMINLESARKAFENMQKEIFKPVQLLSYPPKSVFIGRKKELQELQDLTTNLEKNKKIVITGVGGIGKTQLAAEFARNFIQKHADYNVIWVDMGSEQSLETSLTDIAKSSQCNLPVDGKDAAQIVNEINNYFKDTKTLFIFDNVENPEFYKKYHFDDDFSVLLTSRYSDWQNYPKIELKAFTNNEAVQFAKGYINKPGSDENISKLITKLGNLPLAMQQAAAYMNKKKKTNSKYSIDDFLNDFDSSAKEVLEHKHFSNNVDERYSQTLHSTWRMTMDAIGKTLGSENAAQLVNLMSFLPTEVPIKTLKLGFEPSEYSLVEDALALLSDYSMIDLVNDRTIIHEAVQSVTKSMLDLDLPKRAAVLRQIANMMRRIATSNAIGIDEKIKNTEIFVKTFREFLKFDKNVKDIANYHALFVDVTLLYADIAKQQNKLVERYKILESADDFIRKKKMSYSVGIVRVKMELAECCETIQAKVLNDKISETLKVSGAELIYRKLAQEKGSLSAEDKEKLFEEVLKANDDSVSNSQVGELYDKVLEIYDAARINGGISLSSQARKLYEEVAEISNAESWKNKDILRSVAKSNQKTKNYDKAIDFYEKSLPLLSEEERTDVKFSLAECLNEKKDHVKALEKLKEVEVERTNRGKSVVSVKYEMFKSLQHTDKDKALQMLSEMVGDIRAKTTRGDLLDSQIAQMKEFDRLKGLKRSASKEEEESSLADCKRPRVRRAASRCLFSKEDVDEFSKNGKIDYEKFLKFLKENYDEGMNEQLMKFVKNDHSAENPDFEALAKTIIENGGFDELNVDKRMNLLPHNEPGAPAWRKVLSTGAHSVMTVHGAYATIVTCSRDISSSSCMETAGGIAWSVLHLEEGLVKSEIRLYRGLGGAVGAAFDVIDIGIQIKTITDCHKRQNTRNACSEGEIRDSIVSLSIDGVSFLAGVTFATLAMPEVGMVVAFGLFVVQIVYSGISAVVEFNLKYHATTGEDWSIFWRKSLFIDQAHDVKALASRTNLVQSYAESVWNTLQDQPASVKAYGMGLGYIESEKVTKQYSSTIILDIKIDNPSLSRVEPRDMDYNVEMICLPASTLKDFEKGIHADVPSAKYFCENAMVFAHKNRQGGKYVVLNLQYVDNGVISGSDKWHNIFMIHNSRKAKVSLKELVHRPARSFFGSIFSSVRHFFLSIPKLIKKAVTTEFHLSDVNSGKVYESVGLNVFGGNDVSNRFVFFSYSDLFHLHGGANSSNMFDFSQLGTGDDFWQWIQFNVSYQPGNFRVMLDTIFLNPEVILNDEFDEETDSRNYTFIGRKMKGERIICPRENTTTRFVVVAGGGSGRAPVNVESFFFGYSGDLDVIYHCPYVVMAPFTEIHCSARITQTISVKIMDYKGTDLKSTIFLGGSSVRIYFSEFDLVNGDAEMKYVSEKHSLHITLKFGDNRFLIIVENYSYPKAENLVQLVNKHNHNVVPNFPLPKNGTDVDIKSYELNIVCLNDSKRNLLENRDDTCSNVAYTDKNLKILTLVQFHTEESAIIGSDHNDLIRLYKKTIYARGREGQDIYVVEESDVEKVVVFNYASDGIVDFIILPEIPNTFAIQNDSMIVKYKNITVEIRDYLKSPQHRHLAFVNGNNIFMPLINARKFAPFIQASAYRNDFTLLPAFKYPEIVIDAEISDIEIYRDGDNWLIFSKDARNPLKIIIPNYYANWDKWSNLVWYLHNNGTVRRYDDFIFQHINVLDYKENLELDYSNMVGEYVANLSVSSVIVHNHSKYVKKRIGFLILEKISPKNILLEKGDNDLILTDKYSSKSITIKDWDLKDYYRITNVEFIDPLESVTIIGLDRFSLREIPKMQSLFDKAAENYDLEGEYTPLMKLGVQCVISRKHIATTCLGFNSINHQIQFVKKHCEGRAIALFRSRMNFAQVVKVVQKLRNDVILRGYNETISRNCDLIFKSIL